MSGLGSRHPFEPPDLAKRYCGRKESSLPLRRNMRSPLLHVAAGGTVCSRRSWWKENYAKLQTAVVVNTGGPTPWRRTASSREASRGREVSDTGMPLALPFDPGALREPRGGIPSRAWGSANVCSRPQPRLRVAVPKGGKKRHVDGSLAAPTEHRSSRPRRRGWGAGSAGMRMWCRGRVCLCPAPLARPNRPPSPASPRLRRRDVVIPPRQVQGDPTAQLYQLPTSCTGPNGESSAIRGPSPMTGSAGAMHDSHGKGENCKRCPVTADDRYVLLGGNGTRQPSSFWKLFLRRNDER